MKAAFFGNNQRDLDRVYGLGRMQQVRDMAEVLPGTVTAENFAAAVGWLRTAGMEEVEMAQISVSRGRPVGGLHLMTAQNPVFLLSWRIPERGVEG